MEQKQLLLDTIEPEVAERLITRREAIRRGASTSSVVAAGLVMGSFPIALAALARDAGAQTSLGVREVLEFAYTLENLEYYFYLSATTAAGFAGAYGQLTAAQKTAFTTILEHEKDHVDFLGAALSALGASPPTFTAASFDFTGGNGAGNGPFAAATTNGQVLLAAAQAFEDTGVRAYKGQAPALIGNKAVLTAALEIHSVEARHAAKIRRLRMQAAPSIAIKPWIEGEASGITGLDATGQAAVAAVYAGDNVTAQGGADLGPIAAAFGGSAAASAAFDEPLTAEQVLAIVNPFIVGGA